MNMEQAWKIAVLEPGKTWKMAVLDPGGPFMTFNRYFILIMYYNNFLGKKIIFDCFQVRQAIFQVLPGSRTAIFQVCLQSLDSLYSGIYGPIILKIFMCAPLTLGVDRQDTP